MSGVVLRCPHCGTTRASLGECEACHEAEVRHYCTNHSPGVWLNGPVCSECGARLGDTPKPAPPRPSRPEREKPSAEIPTSERRRWPPEMVGPWTRRRKMPPVSHDMPSETTSARPDYRTVTLADLIREAVLRARKTRPVPPHEPEPLAVVPPLAGCLLRSLILMFVLFMLFSFMSFFIGSLFMPGF